MKRSLWITWFWNLFFVIIFLQIHLVVQSRSLQGFVDVIYVFFFPSALMAFLTSHIQQQIHQKHNFSVPKSYERLWKPLMTFTGPKFAGRCFFFWTFKKWDSKTWVLRFTNFLGIVGMRILFFYMSPPSRALCMRHGWEFEWMSEDVMRWCLGVLVFFFGVPQNKVTLFHGNLRGPPNATPPRNKVLLRDY